MGGQKIDDHSFWAGGAANGSPFPMGAKVKPYNSCDGAGELNRYEDTTETIKAQQDKSVSKVKAHPQKENYRN